MLGHVGDIGGQVLTTVARTSYRLVRNRSTAPTAWTRIRQGASGPVPPCWLPGAVDKAALAPPVNAASRLTLPTNAWRLLVRKLDEDAIANALWRDEKLRHHLRTVYRIADGTDADQTTFADALGEALAQPAITDVTAKPHDDRAVFRAAVLALASSARSWSALTRPRPSRRRIPRTRRGLAGHCVRGSRSSSRGSSVWRGGRRQIIATTPPMRPARLVGELKPAAEVAGFYRGRPVPPDLDRPHESEPAKQVHAVGTQRARRATTRLQVPQECRDRYDNDTVGVNKLVRLEQVARRHERPHRRTASNDRSRGVSAAPVTRRNRNHERRRPAVQRHKPVR